MHSLNLGILAHVDAGKTSLTERLLYAAGVIEEIGSVDGGSTLTDSLALERQRGITIKSAVASFVLRDDVTVNLIDTPGHPDFIAEVERVLSVLDGAVLVISAVEGVQAQTRILLRTLRRLRIPTLLFVNKVDRSGADAVRTLRDIAERLTGDVIPMGRVEGAGSRQAAVTPYGPKDAALTARLADVLTRHDDALLAACLRGAQAPLPHRRLRDALTAQTRQVLVHPVFFGSAITGVGVAALTSKITELLPRAANDADAGAAGAVFKIERGSGGEKTAYVRMFSGTLRVRERVPFGPARHERIPAHHTEIQDGKITSIGVFDRGAVTPRVSVSAGQIALVRGLGGIRIGDVIGAGGFSARGQEQGGEQGENESQQRPGTPLRTPHQAHTVHHFAPPSLETVVVPRRAVDKGALHAALTQLAEQDPLIGLRLDEFRQEIFVSLYGEVQKEVIEATLADDFGVRVTFRESTVICVERPVGTGAAMEYVGGPTNPFLGTVGLRIEPAAVGSEVAYRLEVELGSMPAAFMRAVEESVRQTLRQGLHGWQVTDCTVVLTHSGFVGPLSTAADFRNLTPLVLADALRQAGTRVHEPMHRFRLDIPGDALDQLLTVLARLRALPTTTTPTGASYVLEGDIPAARVHELQQQLPTLTRGEGVWESAFDHYQPVRGDVPVRPRTDNNPFNRKEYLLHVVRRVQGDATYVSR